MDDLIIIYEKPSCHFFKIAVCERDKFLLKIILLALLSSFVFNKSSLASDLFLDCTIRNEITDTGFFRKGASFSVETDGNSSLTIHIPPDGFVILNQFFHTNVNHIYAHEFGNLTSKTAFLQKDIFSAKNIKKWHVKYIVARINQTIGFEADCINAGSQFLQ